MNLTAWLFCVSTSFGFAASPEVRIVPAYEGVARYLRALEDEPEAAPLELYRQYVSEPYRGCYLTPSPMIFLRAPGYLAELEKAIEFLQVVRVEHVVREAITRSAEQLRGPNTVEVCLSPLDPNDSVGREAMNGVTGRAGERIVLEVYPQPGWLDALPYLVAHEYHHIVMFRRYLDPTEPVDLLGTLLVEGRADTFAGQLYPDATAPWTHSLTAEQEREQWVRMEPHLASTDEAVKLRYLFGGSGVPRWTGYTIGFRIMSRFLERRPHLDVEAWSALDAEVILRESGYPSE